MLRALILLFGALDARASAPDAFGVGGVWQGMGGGGVAVVDDGTSALLNPAGLSRIRRPTAGIGLQAVRPSFAPVPDLWWDTNRDGSVDERDTPLRISATPDPITAIQAHVGRHVGGKFGLGLVAHFPLDTLVRFKTFEPELPTYPFWDNRLERYALAAGIGGEPLPGLSIGAGVDTLASARLTVLLTADVGVSGGAASTATGADQLVTEAVIDTHEIDFQLVPAFAPVFGFQWDVGQAVPPLDGLVLGAAYHEQVGLPLDVELDLQANVAIEDVGSLDPFVTALVADAQLMLFDHFVPRRVSMGLAWTRGDTFTLYADLRWSDWTKMQLNVARLVTADLDAPMMDVDDLIVDGNEFTLVLRATWGVRMGTELQLPEWTIDGPLRYVRLRARGGFGLEPSPMVSQGASSALLDSGRTFFTLGFGGEVWDPFALVDGPVALDGFFQFHTLATGVLDRRTVTPQAGYPIGQTGVPYGGQVVVFGGEWSFQY